MTSRSKIAALYARVSTDHQTTENQLKELRAMAKRMGWKLDGDIDRGVRGAKGRDQRPEFDKMLKAAARREYAANTMSSWHGP